MGRDAKKAAITRCCPASLIQAHSGGNVKQNKKTHTKKRPCFVALLRDWVRRKASCDSLAGGKGGEQRRDVLDIVCPSRLVWVGFQVTVRYFQTTHSAFRLRIFHYFSTDNTCAVLF